LILRSKKRGFEMKGFSIFMLSRFAKKKKRKKKHYEGNIARCVHFSVSKRSSRCFASIAQRALGAGLMILNPFFFNRNYTCKVFSSTSPRRKFYKNNSIVAFHLWTFISTRFSTCKTVSQKLRQLIYVEKTSNSRAATFYTHYRMGVHYCVSILVFWGKIHEK